MDRLEAELGERLQIIHLNIQDSAGRELAARFNIRLTPTFIMFDSSGNQLWQSVGMLDPNKVYETLTR